MKKLKLLFIGSLPLMLTACDPIEDVATWINDFFGSYLADISCWVFQMLILSLQWLIDFVLLGVTEIILLLPVYPVVVPSIASYPFMSYAAYFLPIAEIATLSKYLIDFYIVFWFGRVLLRWAKILK